MKNRLDGKSSKRLFLLAFFVGMLGIEYFYVKRWKLGLAKLLITLIAASLMVWTPTIISTANQGLINDSVKAQKSALQALRALATFQQALTDIANAKDFEAAKLIIKPVLDLPSTTTIEPALKALKDAVALDTATAALQTGLSALQAAPSETFVSPVWSLWDVESYANTVRAMLIVGGVILALVFAWSMFNAVTIYMGSFTDEYKNKVSTWQSSEIEVINNLISKGAH